MHVLDNTGRERARLPGIEHLTVAGRDQGLAGLSVWRQSMAPGSATPPHRHDCEEVVLVLEGAGEVHIEGKVLAFGPDTTLVLPPHVPHQIFNTGSVPLELVAAFSATPVGTFLPGGEPIALPWKS
ncbi:MAG TPA: cupin domain-containing protein [Burkholderiales bacterium]|nr:cupin domain-containing protein [Burkholderiales bacterium]